MYRIRILVGVAVTCLVSMSSGCSSERQTPLTAGGQGSYEPKIFVRDAGASASVMDTTPTKP